EIDAWWIMSCWMMVTPDGMKLNEYDFEYDFHDLPVWNELNEFQRSRIVDSAIDFLRAYYPDDGRCNDSWWEKRELIYWPIVAGCRAFFLSVDHERIHLLVAGEWKKWTPAITYYIYRALLYPNEDNKRRGKNTFLQLAKMVASEEFNETLLWIAECENEQENFFLTSRIEQLWDNQLAVKFLQAIKEGKFKLVNEAQILRAICQHDFSLGQPLLESWLTNPFSDEEKSRQRAILAGQLFFEFAEDAGWSNVWPVIQSDAEFGKKVIEGVVSADRHIGNTAGGLIAGKLDEASVADLYIWLFQQYPLTTIPG
ncbi:hypothetical protein L0244_39825, partial [bacterium]|nr:hypothetical protein [bacterium]